MSTINPQGPVEAAAVLPRGGDRTDAKPVPRVVASDVGQNGKVLPGERTSGKKLPDELAPRDAADVAKRGEDLADAVAKLNDYVQNVQRDLRFSLDDSTGTSVIHVVDRQSSEVIRRIPAELTLSLAQKLSNDEPLLLFSAQV